MEIRMRVRLSSFSAEDNDMIKMRIRMRIKMRITKKIRLSSFAAEDLSAVTLFLQHQSIPLKLSIQWCLIMFMKRWSVFKIKIVVFSKLPKCPGLKVPVSMELKNMNCKWLHNKQEWLMEENFLLTLLDTQGREIVTRGETCPLQTNLFQLLQDSY